jgi:hypothetical protein
VCVCGFHRGQQRHWRFGRQKSFRRNWRRSQRHPEGASIAAADKAQLLASLADAYAKFSRAFARVNRLSNVRGRFQQQELPFDGLPGPSDGFRGLAGQEAPASLQAFRRAFGDDYLWHSGTAFSSLVPQAFNQVRTSCPQPSACEQRVAPAQQEPAIPHCFFGDKHVATPLRKFP